MKFDLRINPSFKVIDAKTGLEVTRVRWVDDATHEVAWCDCARKIDTNPLLKLSIVAFGESPEAWHKECIDDQYIQAMPKVKIDVARKTVLVNVDDTLQPEQEPVNTSRPVTVEKPNGLVIAKAA